MAGFVMNTLVSGTAQYGDLYIVSWLPAAGIGFTYQQCVLSKPITYCGGE
jgi:hypothetical protein